MFPFVVGTEYDRSQLLEYVGSRQAQTGVIWGKSQPGCTIVTSGGRHGLNAGYYDQKRSDGTWEYFGQGRSGDHSAENAANRRLLENAGTILVFLTREPSHQEIKQKGNYRKRYLFDGLFNFLGQNIIVPKSGIRAGEKLFQFNFVPLSDNETNDEAEEQTLDISKMREAIRNFEKGQNGMILSVASYRQRSRQVRRYTLLRASGNCEACGTPAPFLMDNGKGFLEVHHINRLVDDGLDEPSNVAAVCPNCHRRAHYSIDRLEFRIYLLKTAANAEARVKHYEITHE